MADRAAYDVLGVGNAIVDVLAKVDDDFVTKQKVTKGSMTLIDEERAIELHHAMPASVTVSGGSAANTITGLASFGAKTAYLGKVADDKLGKVFHRDIRAAGVDFDTHPLKNGPATARCLILVTPDAERTMNTFLGASTMFDEKDIDLDRIASAGIVYLEGYLFDRKEAKSAFVRASVIAEANGRKVALTLSDRFCVDRHRESFRHLVTNHIDILFANEDELLALYETRDFDAAVQLARADNVLAFVTRSAKGSIILSGDEVHVVDSIPPTPSLVDTTGAGDQYAAGALYGLTKGRPLVECGRLGAIAATEVISHFGPRPETSYRDLAEAAGF